MGGCIWWAWAVQPRVFFRAHAHHLHAATHPRRLSTSTLTHALLIEPVFPLLVPVPDPSPAASPRIGTAPSPPLPGMLGSQRTPGELPPPPATLVEKFLRDHNFLAVQQEQMTVGGAERARRCCTGMRTVAVLATARLSARPFAHVGCSLLACQHLGDEHSSRLMATLPPAA